MRSMFLAVACFLSLAFTLAAADLSGRYSGTYGERKAVMELKQAGEQITGTAGPSAQQQWEIKDAKLAGGTLTFVLDASVGPLKFEMKIEGDVMSGSATPAGGGEAVKVQFRRM